MELVAAPRQLPPHFVHAGVGEAKPQYRSVQHDDGLTKALGCLREMAVFSSFLGPTADFTFDHARVDAIGLESGRERQWAMDTFITPRHHKTGERLKDADGNKVPPVFHFKKGAEYWIPGQAIMTGMMQYGEYLKDMEPELETEEERIATGAREERWLEQFRPCQEGPSKS